MQEQEIFAKVQAVLVKNLQVEESRISMDTNLKEDLKVDSLEFFELMYTIENELKITFPEEKASEVSTIGEAVSIIKKEYDKKNS